MKKLFLIFTTVAIALSGLLVSCSDKDDTTPEGSETPEPEPDDIPVIAWDANPNFEPCDLDTYNLGYKLTLGAPFGIDWLMFTVNSDNSTLNASLESEGLSVNKALDIIDGDSVDVLKSFGINCGSALYGATSVEFDLSGLVDLMPEYANYETFTATIKLSMSDSEGQVVEKTITVYEVNTIPTITWAANPDFGPYDISGISGDVDVELAVEAPQGIETFTLTINTDNNDLNSSLSSSNGITVNTAIDLINGSLVGTLQGLGIECGEDLYGATSADLDLNGLADLLVELAGEDVDFTATVDLAITDPVGQSVDKTLTLYVPDVTPTITWAANPNFDDYDLSGDNLDVVIDVDVPLGIETFTFAISTNSLVLNIALAALGVSTNTDYDLIYGDLVKTLQSIGIDCGEQLYGATHVEFDMTALAELVAEVGISFSGTINLTVADPKGHTASKDVSIYM